MKKLSHLSLSAALALAATSAASAAGTTPPDLGAAAAQLSGTVKAGAAAIRKQDATANQAQSATDAHSGVRRMIGIEDLESNRTYEKFSWRGEETFLISRRNFSKRQEAVRFCAGFNGYKLGKPGLSMLLTMAGLPFDHLRKSNMIEEKVLSGRSGLIFWVSADAQLPERALEQFDDAVWVLLDGCGPNCSGVAPLSEVNKALENAGQPARRIPAICSETASKDF